MTVEFDTNCLFPRKAAAFLNLWYGTYQEAKDTLDQYPARFLFPFRSQYVVCEGSMLEHLGIDTNDPDWAKIGHDWAAPANLPARDRLAVLLRSKLTVPERRRPERDFCSKP